MKKIHPDIIKNISDNRIYRRMWFIEEIFNQIVKTTNSETEVKINQEYLYLAIKSYFIDIERLKHFHQIDKTERYKIAGYMTKWIAKMRPIYFESTKDPVAEQILLINARLAFQVGYITARIEIDIEKHKEIVTDELLHEMLYALQYRDINTDQLVLWFKTVGGSLETITG